MKIINELKGKKIKSADLDYFQDEDFWRLRVITSGVLDAVIVDIVSDMPLKFVTRLGRISEGAVDCAYIGQCIRPGYLYEFEMYSDHFEFRVASKGKIRAGLIAAPEEDIKNTSCVPPPVGSQG